MISRLVDVFPNIVGEHGSTEDSLVYSYTREDEIEYVIVDPITKGILFKVVSIII
jgi:hypothetical protein